jgi:hypothetical protein
MATIVKIECDGCGSFSAGYANAGSAIRHVRFNLNRDGWQCNHNTRKDLSLIHI